MFKAVDARYPTPTYAVKEVICTDPTSVDTVHREIDTMSKARHANIVRILEFGRKILPNGYSILIAQEYCPCGDLNTRLTKPSSFGTNLKWMIQITNAISFLHSSNPPIVHRDFKPHNIMLDQHGNLKLGDFGLAREYLPWFQGRQYPPMIMKYYMTSDVGPLHWMAPEVFGQHSTEKADIFSLAGVFYAILTRDLIQDGAKFMYGVFATFVQPPIGKVGLGYAMAMANIYPSATVLFPSFEGQGPIPHDAIDQEHVGL